MRMLAILPPKTALSDALRDIKANSSKWVHESKVVSTALVGTIQLPSRIDQLARQTRS
jgi:hypothetical protein